MAEKERIYVGLGVSFHDPAVTILNAKGEVVFAEAAERYLQNKRALNYAPDDLVRLPKLIKKYGGDCDVVVGHSWPRAMGYRMGFISWILKKLAPLMPNSETVTGNDGYAWPVGTVVGGLEWMARSIGGAGQNLRESPYIDGKVIDRGYDHHLVHAATAAFTSPYDEAAVAIVDGFGGRTACSFYRFKDGRFENIPTKGTWSDGSLGHFYSLVCRLCGFDPMRGEEWKVMGLAPYGKVDRAMYEKLRECIDIKDLRIVFKVNQKKYLQWLKEAQAMAAEACRTPEGQADLAASWQALFMDLMTELLNNFYKKGVSDTLILSGGCALNSTYNGQILERTPFKRLHVPSAPGDDGCSMGAAFLAWRQDQPKDAKLPRAMSPYLGSEASAVTLQNCVEFTSPDKIKHCPGTIAEEAAKILAGGGIIGWMQGRAEFGPRALGNRSILADPRPKTMKDEINARVKFREKFRPFAPAILHEHGERYFENYQESPYMERTLNFRVDVREQIPAVVHENGSGRLQSVKREWAPKYHDLISAFHRLTGVPLVLNTSFNVMGKPIVHSIEDAMGVFHTSGLDALVIEEYLFLK